MQVTKARTSVCWEPSGVCFGIASMMTLQNVWQNVPFAKRKLHLSARNPWCKKKFRRAHGTQSAQISLTLWRKNTCLWLSTSRSSPLASACRGTVAEKPPRKPWKHCLVCKVYQRCYTPTMVCSLLHAVLRNFVMSGMCDILHHHLITLNQMDLLRAWWRPSRKHCPEHNVPYGPPNGPTVPAHHTHEQHIALSDGDVDGQQG